MFHLQRGCTSGHRALRLAAALASLGSIASAAAAPDRVCTPSVTQPIVVASPAERNAAAARAEPPITDTSNGFAWPDTPLGVIRTPDGYRFFGSDGGNHARQKWHGHSFGNDKAGSIVTTAGTLDQPLGTAAPLDVTISPNPDPSVNPNYPRYGYMGGGPVYRVPQGLTGGGNLLAVYHAELPDDALYAVLGLAASSDDGLHWTDLGEIIRLNQAYAPGLDGFEIGDGPLVLSPDRRYFYLYFPDWLANGTPHATTINNVSVARALAEPVLRSAFGPEPHRAVAFEKFYHGDWALQPAIGGASTDLLPGSPYQGYIDVHYDTALARYVMLISNDTIFAYAESTDGLAWTRPISLGTYGPIAAYPRAVGLGEDPQELGRRFYVYFTLLPADGSGWPGGSLRRFTLSCP